MSAWADQQIRALWARLCGVILRGIVQYAQDVPGAIQRVQVTGPGGLVIDAERPEHYGFHSVPLPGCEAVLAHSGADPSHPIVIGEADRARPLAPLPTPGTTQIYGLLVYVTGPLGSFNLPTHTHSGVTTGGGVSGPPVVGS